MPSPEPSLPTEDQLSGGRRALSGFLAQLLGLLGFAALVHAEQSTPEAEETGAAIFYTEAWGEDVTSATPQGWVLCQFKYSQAASPAPISRPDLIEIAENMRRSANLLAARAQQIRGFELVTNRSLTGPALEILEAAARGESHGELPDDHPAREVLAILRVRVAEPGVWAEAVRAFGRSLGAFDDEIDRGLNMLVGTMAQRATIASLQPLVQADLFEAFVQARAARPITAARVTTLSGPELLEARSLCGLTNAPFRRSAVDDIAKAANEHALVVVDGPGGAGKSVALWDWVNSTQCSSPERGLAAWRQAYRLEGGSLGRIVGDWGNWPPQHPWRSQKADVVFSRVEVANPAAQVGRPILHLALDGLDEQLREPTEIERLIEWSWHEELAATREYRKPSFSLVVSCRGLHSFLSRWFPKVASGASYAGPKPLTITLERFSTPELRAVSEGLNEPDGSRIRAALTSVDDAGERYEEELLATISERPSVGAGDEIVRALHHPAVWGSFIDLDTPLRTQVLDETADALDKLGERFIDRFCGRVEMRGYVRDRDRTVSMLLAVGAACSDKSAPHDRRTDWVRPVIDDFGVPQEQANLLYREALSYGLVSEDANDQWRWAYAFVEHYLARRSAEVGQHA